MALIKCPECEKEISDASAVCIHCGYPLNKNPGIQETEAPNIKIKEKVTPQLGDEEEKTKAGCIWIGFVAIILSFFVIGIIGENDSSSASTKPKSYTPTYEYNAPDYEYYDAPDYEYDVPDDGLSSGEYWCMGKGDTCQNKTYSAYDFYCSSCDPDGDNIEG